MKPEDRALLVVVMSVVTVTAGVGGYLVATPSAPLTAVVHWGGVFLAPSPDAGFTFSVTPPGGTLIGAWSSTGKTCAFLFGQGWSIPHAIIQRCIDQGVSSGTFHENLTSPWPAETYTLAFLSDSPVVIRVTRTIQVVY